MTAGADDGGWFGRWVVDDAGAPAFDLATGDRNAGAADRVLPDGGPGALWHQIGNAATTAVADASGGTTLYATARGMVRVTGRGQRWGLLGRPTTVTACRFGLGYAEWEARCGEVAVTRRVSTAPGTEPVVHVDVRVGPATGPGRNDASEHRYGERWPVDPLPLVVGALMTPYRPPPAGYSGRAAWTWRGLYAASDVVRRLTDAGRRLLAPTLYGAPHADPDHRAVVTPARRRAPASPPTEPAWFDRSVPDLVVVALDDDLPVTATPAGLWVTLPATGDAVTLRFAVALADGDAEIDTLVQGAREGSATERAGRWAGALRVETGDDALDREAVWHATYLAGAQQPDALFGRRYVAQGSAYGFVHGLQGAPRDYAIFAVPLAFVDPAGARDLLEVMMRMTSPGGTIFYAHTGRGMCTSGGIHSAPTDLPIFFLWALTEYVWATGDVAFLDTPVPHYPPGRGVATTPRDRVLLAFRTLRDRVRLGPHGLLRVGSGDWADPISAMVPDRAAFHRDGESGFNSTFAAFALPRAAALVRDSHPDDADEMDAFAVSLRDAVAATWTGRWFLRGYDGRGCPIGEDHLFLDGQVFGLIAEIGPRSDREELVHQIAARCDDPSPIGATILDRPHPVHLGMLAPGWDCNGGVWAAINAFLAWGYATVDPARAWRNLHDQTLAAHARAYPHVWYGIWSGPDAYNAHFGEQPGETFVQPATPMQEYPIMNANAHAGPLLALLRVLGVETGPAGIVVRARGDAVGPWRLRTALGEISSGG